MSAWADLGLVVAGGVLTQAGAVITQLLSRQREREQRADDREVAVEAARRTFQRDTILELQEALQREMRSLGAIHHADVMAHRADAGAGRWRGQQLDVVLNEESHQAGVRVLLLMERVLDADARELVRNTHTRIAMYEASTTEQDGLSRVFDAQEAWARANARLGELLRQLS